MTIPHLRLVTKLFVRERTDAGHILSGQVESLCTRWKAEALTVFSSCAKSHTYPTEGGFPMSIEPEIGSWYIVVTCHKCKATVFLFRDLTEGKGSLSATYLVRCPRCGHQGEYEGHHYRHAATN